MGRCRVVKPDVIRMPLSDGDWIDVKKVLNAGEWASMVEALNDPAMKERRPFVRPLAYLVAWSLVDLDDKPMPYALELPENTRRAALQAQDGDTLVEILNAVTAHETALDQEREARKNAQAGASASSAISTSAA